MYYCCINETFLASLWLHKVKKAGESLVGRFPEVRECQPQVTSETPRTKPQEPVDIPSNTADKCVARSNLLFILVLSLHGQITLNYISHESLRSDFWELGVSVSNWSENISWHFIFVPEVGVWSRSHFGPFLSYERFQSRRTLPFGDFEGSFDCYVNLNIKNESFATLASLRFRPTGIGRLPFNSVSSWE